MNAARRKLSSEYRRFMEWAQWYRETEDIENDCDSPTPGSYEEYIANLCRKPDPACPNRMTLMDMKSYSHGPSRPEIDFIRKEIEALRLWASEGCKIGLPQRTKFWLEMLLDEIEVLQNNPGEYGQAFVDAIRMIVDYVENAAISPVIGAGLGSFSGSGHGHNKQAAKKAKIVASVQAIFDVLHHDHPDWPTPALTARGIVECHRQGVERDARTIRRYIEKGDLKI